MQTIPIYQRNSEQSNGRKDLGLLAYSLLFKTKIKLKNQLKIKKVKPEINLKWLKIFYFHYKEVKDGRGVGTNVSTYKNDEETIRPLLNEMESDSQQ